MSRRGDKARTNAIEGCGWSDGRTKKGADCRSEGLGCSAKPSGGGPLTPVGMKQLGKIHGIVRELIASCNRKITIGNLQLFKIGRCLAMWIL